MDAQTRRVISLSKFKPDLDSFIGVTMTCSYYIGPGASSDYCLTRARCTFEREAKNMAKHFRYPSIVMGEIESVYEDAPAKNGVRFGRMYFRCAVEITEKGSAE